MNKIGLYIIIGIVIVAAFLIFNSFYVLEEGYQAVLLRFGQIVDVQTEAGLKFKLPLSFADADIVRKFPKKLLSWDGAARVIPTGTPEAQLIWVDTTARWKIVDIEKFFESLGSKNEALKKLDDIIDPAVYTIINGNLLTEAVRNTYQEMKFTRDDILSKDNLINAIKNANSENGSEALKDIRKFVPATLLVKIDRYTSESQNEANIAANIANSNSSRSSVEESELLDFLNQLLINKNLYNEDFYDEDNLTDHAKTLITKSETEELAEQEQAILNRLLLEAAFKNIIRVNPVKRGRSVLSAQILDYARKEMYVRDTQTDSVVMKDGKPVNQFGIELLDIVIRQIRYAKDVRESVFDQMVQERNQQATKIREEGRAKKEKLLGDMQKEVDRLISEGEKEAEDTKGKADATVTRMYAEAYSKDPRFFEFWRKLESYKKTLPQFGKTLSTDAEYFDYLYNPDGR